MMSHRPKSNDIEILRNTRMRRTHFGLDPGSGAGCDDMASAGYRLHTASRTAPGSSGTAKA